MPRREEILTQLRWAIPVWMVSLITAWLPDNRVTIRLRGWMLTPFIAQCGRGLTVARDVTLLNTHRLTVGDLCYFAKGTWINAMGGVTIGEQVITSPYVVISSSTHGFRDGSVRFGGTHPASVRIGKGCWIASHSVVSAGVSIGSGCLVAANAAVVTDMPNDSVIGGVPARRLGQREDNPSEITAQHQINV